VAVARLAGEQWGVLSLGELRMCGMTREAVNVRVRNGRFHPLHRGVYAVGHPRITLEGRFLAAVKACGPTAVLSHFSAAALYELLRWDDRYPEVTTTAQRTHHGIRVHRSSTLHAEDITRYKGIPVTTPARTAVDLAATPEQRLVLEADGAEWHDDRLAREDDAERQALLEAHGERVLRVTWSQAISQRVQTLKRLRAAGAPTYTLTPR
jgi:predicted transcriptional regulator of viral defense system